MVVAGSIIWKEFRIFLNRMTGKGLKGSTVVEMAYLMPVVLLSWMLIIFALFYYHDKNIVAGAAWETAIVGSELLHEDPEIQEEKAEQYFRGRIRGKMLFFSSAAVNVVVEEEKITVRADAAQKGLTLSTEKSAEITKPEKKIRRVKGWKEKIVERNTEE